jgi:hypothetical protein
MPAVGFESTISVLERAKTVRALDRAATPIGTNNLKSKQYNMSSIILTVIARDISFVIQSISCIFVCFG